MLPPAVLPGSDCVGGPPLHFAAFEQHSKDMKSNAGTIISLASLQMDQQSMVYMRQLLSIRFLSVWTGIIKQKA